MEIKTTGIILIKSTLIFLLETIVQCVYLSLAIRYFDKYSGTLYDDFPKILVDTLSVFFIIKAVFYLPVYLIVHKIFKNLIIRHTYTKSSFIHVITFVAVTLIISFIYPSYVYHSIVNLVILILLSFLTSIFILSRDWKGS